MAVFEKPVPLGDFLNSVERGLGLAATIFPTDAAPAAPAGRMRIPDLLANLRQDMQAEAAFLINDRGRVVARAGDLRDSSLEVSLVAALTATFTASLKVAKSNRQAILNQFSVFTGGDDDLVLMTVNPSFALLLASNSKSSRRTLFDTLQAMLAVRAELDKSLRSLVVEPVTRPVVHTEAAASDSASGPPEMESLLKAANTERLRDVDLDRFWDEAAKTSTGPSIPDAISYEQARKMGLTRDE